MKNILIMTGLVLVSISNIYAQCDDYRNAMEGVQSFADNAYTYSKKAYNANNLKEVQYYAKKAKNSADNAMSLAYDAQTNASDCWCNEGQNFARKMTSLAETTFSFSKKAYYAYSLENALKYSKKAMNIAKKCKREASSAENECD